MTSLICVHILVLSSHDLFHRVDLQRIVSCEHDRVAFQNGSPLHRAHRFNTPTITCRYRFSPSQTKPPTAVAVSATTSAAYA